MKFISIFLSLTSLLFSVSFLNPHEFQLDGIDKNKNCVECHNLATDAANGTDIQTVSPTSSMACLNCHDGVSAMSQAINSPGSGSYYPTSNYALNTSGYFENMPAEEINTAGNIDISHGHPISIEYLEGIGDLKSKSSTVNNWSTASNINDILINNKIECGSCHNPHMFASTQYLRHTNNMSELCTTCHNK